MNCNKVTISNKILTEDEVLPKGNGGTIGVENWRRASLNYH